METEFVNKEGKYSQTIFDYQISPETSPISKLTRLHKNSQRRLN